MRTDRDIYRLSEQVREIHARQDLTDYSSSPTFGVYGDDATPTLEISGTAAFLLEAENVHFGNEEPIICTSPDHGLVTGMKVNVPVCTMNAAEGYWRVTVIDNDAFTLDGSNGSGEGGTGNWNTAGLYLVAFGSDGSETVGVGHHVIDVQVGGAEGGEIAAVTLGFEVIA